MTRLDTLHEQDRKDVQHQEESNLLQCHVSARAAARLDARLPVTGSPVGPSRGAPVSFQPGHADHTRTHAPLGLSHGTEADGADPRIQASRSGGEENHRAPVDGVDASADLFVSDWRGHGRDRRALLARERFPQEPTRKPQGPRRRISRPPLY